MCKTTAQLVSLENPILSAVPATEDLADPISLLLQQEAMTAVAGGTLCRKAA